MSEPVDANDWVYTKVLEALGTPRFWSAWRLYVNHCIKHGCEIKQPPLDTSVVRQLREDARNETTVQLPLF